MSEAANMMRRLRGFEQQMLSRSDATLLKAARNLEADAVNEAPIEFGDLRASAESSDAVERSGGEHSVTVGFKSAYAAAQHEHEDWSHPSEERKRRGTPGGGDYGKAKFLEDPLKSTAAAELAPLLRDGLRPLFRGP